MGDFAEAGQGVLEQQEGEKVLSGFSVSIKSEDNNLGSAAVSFSA